MNYNTSDLKKLTGNYSLESAKQDSCLVMKNGDVASGQEIFDQFLKLTQQSHDAKIRLVNYYTIGDKSQYSEELYIQEKDKYP